MKYHFIVNPKSRSGKGKLIWELLEPEINKRAIEKEVHMTQYRRHAVNIARDISSRGEEAAIVVLGGDGTINEVINGIVDFEKVTLGYLPAGSGNDLARGLGLKRDPLAALEVILNPGEIKPIDIGLMTRAGKERRFAVSTGMGFDAAVCHQAAVSKIKDLLNKLKIGKLTYVSIALQRLYNDPAVPVRVVLDDGITHMFEKTYFAAVMNTPFEGGGFKFCPEADCADGKLNVIIVSGISKLQALRILPTAFKGNHVRFRGVTIYQCEKASIQADRPMMIHTDGEPVFPRRKIEVEVIAGKLKMIIA